MRRRWRRYEKKRGDESEWYSFIKELDRQRARGALAAETPLLWTDEEVQSYLQGSPVLSAVQERLQSIREEYEALDTVWFMSGSLFNKYPYDVPTEAFSFEIFRQAFAAVQAAVVHLQVTLILVYGSDALRTVGSLPAVNVGVLQAFMPSCVEHGSVVQPCVRFRCS
jgi:hypothetical protein